MDACGFESYSLECHECHVLLAGLIDPLDDVPLISAAEA
jgi:hypothetical protein